MKREHHVGCGAPAGRHTMNSIERELASAEQGHFIASSVSRSVNVIIVLILLLSLAAVGSTLMDLLKFTYESQTIRYQDFDQLAMTNPDVCAWIRMEGTGIDNPVVQGKDNFEYLDKGFDGKFYAGGTLFLDYRNRKDLSDPYNIIHGHYMEGGAMFGDLGEYMHKSFFDAHKTGKLLTPRWDYDLTVIGVAKIDAYDDRIYYPHYPGGMGIPLGKLSDQAVNKRELRMGKDRLLALSTCSGAMDNDRIVVFCRMHKTGKH
jgi:sortase B